jgi:hypothetical protein
MPPSLCEHRHDHAHVYMHTQTQSCPCVYAGKGVIMRTLVCAQRQSCPCVYAPTFVNMPTCTCTQMRDHAPCINANMGAILPMRMLSCLYAHKGANMPPAYMHTWVQSCPCVHPHMSAIMLPRVCKNRRDHAHAICHTYRNTHIHTQVRICCQFGKRCLKRFIHAWRILIRRSLCGWTT